MISGIPRGPVAAISASTIESALYGAAYSIFNVPILALTVCSFLDEA